MLTTEDNSIQMKIYTRTGDKGWILKDKVDYNCITINNMHIVCKLFGKEWKSFNTLTGGCHEIFSQSLCLFEYKWCHMITWIGTCHFIIWVNSQRALSCY